MPGLLKEVWVQGIQENPMPDLSFVNASVDMSEYVENNTLNLAEAGIEPGVHEDYFSGNDAGILPVANVADIPHAVVLKTYSTEQTRHRDLQEVELAYDRRSSVINRHKRSLERNIGLRAAHSWAPSTDDEFNKVMKLAAEDSIIDAIIDLEAFYAGLDFVGNMNICLSPEHMARIRKEDKKLYKEMLAEPGYVLYGFKMYRYSKNPIYTTEGVKKPFGSTLDATDLRSSFIWPTEEVFRSFGTTEMYATLRDSGAQADLLSFAQRALVGKIRSNSPKYLSAII